MVTPEIRRRLAVLQARQPAVCQPPGLADVLARFGLPPTAHATDLAAAAGMTVSELRTYIEQVARGAGRRLPEVEE